ncbi:MAG TPA: DsbA family oxidoreductase [Trueperaceae bacterium]
MRVEIWTDIICPWCYLGKRRMETALSRFPHAEQVELMGRSFELDPGAPRRYEVSLDEMLAGKYGVGLERARAMNEQVTELAKGEGLEYRLDVARPGNTFDAHRLLHLAEGLGRRSELEERFMRGYFSEGKAIGDHEVLAGMAKEVGLDESAVREVLAGEAFANAVRADESRARRLGANGVPFFVVDGRYGVSGAQPSDLLLELLQKAWATRDMQTARSAGAD